MLSDIDILIVSHSRISAEDRKTMYVEIMERAMDKYGLPWDAPVEPHITDEEGVKGILRINT